MIQRAPSGHRAGHSHPRARLSDAEVIAMRNDHRSGKGGYATLAARYRCGISTARDICTFRTRLKPLSGTRP